MNDLRLNLLALGSDISLASATGVFKVPSVVPVNNTLFGKGINPALGSKIAVVAVTVVSIESYNVVRRSSSQPNMLMSKLASNIFAVVLFKAEAISDVVVSASFNEIIIL